jgi:hypothetical protein
VAVAKHSGDLAAKHHDATPQCQAHRVFGGHKLVGSKQHRAKELPAYACHPISAFRWRQVLGAIHRRTRKAMHQMQPLKLTHMAFNALKPLYFSARQAISIPWIEAKNGLPLPHPPNLCAAEIDDFSPILDNRFFLLHRHLNKACNQS